jgi:glycosyltransferase involved in cell wall biosynthesis
MKNILFISWDGPQTNYMDGLFLPIFNEIQNQSEYIFHIIQFTWKSESQIALIKEKADDYSIFYTAHPVYRKPNVVIGSLFSIHKGVKFIKNYIAKNDIDIVMPRSTMPAIMVNRIKDRKFEIVYDADGLPLEERVDFLELSQSSTQYKFLKNQELQMLTNADAVITRSKKAINIHLSSIGGKNLEKFSKVINGRSITFFKPNDMARSRIRKDLKIKDESKLFVYSGSLGPQYGWDEMIAIFKKHYESHNDAIFLILTENLKYANKRIPLEIKDNVIVKGVPFEHVPMYLSAADIAFALREPKYSMRGVAPIKLGEYLLMGLPTIASKGIGDTEDILKKAPSCFIYNHHSKKSFKDVIEFIEQVDSNSRNEIRAFAIESFSLEKSAASYIKSLNTLL